MATAMCIISGSARTAGILVYGGGIIMDTRINLAGVELKNPVMTASGTFGSGEEYSEFVDLNRLGPSSPKAWPMCHGREMPRPGSRRQNAA